MVTDKLIPVRMKKEDMGRADVRAFHCGSKPHETPLAEWIKVHSAEAIASRTKIFLYERQSGQRQLVGYGSIAKGYIDTTNEDGSKKRLKVMEIPMLALHEDFWGCPKGITDPEGKYSRQLVRHLQHEARQALAQGQGITPTLTLYVHPDAGPAQTLYLACGFVFAPGRFLPDPDTPPPGLLGMDFKLG